jgi:hypothetical protein
MMSENELTDEQPAVLSELADPDYEILSIENANADQSVLIVATAGHGRVVVHRDRPDLWQRVQAFIAKGGIVPAYVPPVRVPRRDPLAELDTLKDALIAKGAVAESDLIVPVSDQNPKELAIEAKP